MGKDKPVKKRKKKEEPYQKYDRAFQALFEEFREDIGIESKRDYQLDEKWQYKRPDTIIILEDNFDYAMLADKTFPCLKEWNVIEFKSCKDNLHIQDIPKYIANGNLLAAQMLLDKKDKGLDVISDYVALIIVSSNEVTEDIRENFKHCEFRKGFYILEKHPYFPVYLIIIEDIEVIECNYALLLLGNEKKQEELWRQLIREIKKDVKAKKTEKLWKYMTFSVKKNIFQLKEGDIMKEIKDLSEDNESIKKFFDDEFLKKLVKKRGTEFLNKLLEDNNEEFLANLFLKKIRENEAFKKKIQRELKNELLEK